ncbi:MAG TPA: hypothetical protein VM575_08900, partial [Nocardioides sp.]|nr:hypothetical protein [Nocardioides sp.]
VTGVAATGKAGGALLLGKSGLAVTIAAGVVGAAVAVPFLIDVSSDDRSGATDPGHHAVESRTDPFPGPRTQGTAPGRASATVQDAAGADASAGDPAASDSTTGGEIGGVSSDSPPDTSAAPTDPSTGEPTRPTTPTTPSTPTTPTTPGSTLSPDAGIGQPSIAQVSFLGQALTSVTFPVTNVRTGSTVTVVVSNLVGFPLSWGNTGWRCPGAIGGLPGDLIRTETTITCTRTGAEQATGELAFALLTSGASEITATVAQVGGVVDPVADNDVATALINP